MQKKSYESAPTTRRVYEGLTCFQGVRDRRLSTMPLRSKIVAVSLDLAGTLMKSNFSFHLGDARDNDEGCATLMKT